MEKVEVRKSLKEQLLEEEELFRKTGHMYGMSELDLKKRDPVTYEIAYNFLLMSCMDAMGVAKGISTSPVLREAGDGIFALATPTGDIITASHGVWGHLLIPPEVIKWAIRDGVEEDPGIQHGDIFEENFPKIGTMHPPDSYNFVPILWEEELIGWGIGACHRVEVGAITPGAMPEACDNYFGEGLAFLFDKVGRNDNLSREYHRKVENFSRLPSFWLMDARACSGGAILIRERVMEFIRRYGIDYYRKVTREYIEDSRRMAQNRIKAQMVPGRIRKRTCRDAFMKGKKTLFDHQQVDWMALIPWELTLDKDANLVWSVAGATGALSIGVNAGTQSFRAVFSMCIGGMLAYERLNTGAFTTINIKDIPPGSWADPYPVNPWAPTGCSWAFIMPAVATGMEVISRLFYARGYHEEVLAAGAQNAFHEGMGTGPHGMFTTMLNIEGVGGGLPAQPIRDGEDVSWGPYNPLSDTGNAEIYELLTPYIYLGRRTMVDTGGRGKYRGGHHLGSVWMWWYGDGAYSAADVGSRSMIPGNNGMFGAYPAPVSNASWAKGDEIKKLIDQKKPLIHHKGDPLHLELAKLTENEVALKVPMPIVVPESMPKYSIVDVDYSGSAGCGDPIERDPALVKKDLDKGLVSRWAATEIWAVEVSYDEKRREHVIDDNGTEKRRKELLEKRKKRGIPFKEWWLKERQKVMSKENMGEPIVRMMRESMGLSPKYDSEVREFWQLPKGFTF